MTSMSSVSEYKTGRKNSKRNADGMPKEGTKLRAAYDALRSGEIVNLSATKVSATQLTDIYGMDLESVKGSIQGGYIGSRLLGEWDGPYYIPVERIVSSLMEPA